MEKASVEPPEEEEEERPIVNGNGVVVTPGQSPGAGGGRAAREPRNPAIDTLLLWQQALLATEAVGFVANVVVEFGVSRGGGAPNVLPTTHESTFECFLS